MTSLLWRRSTSSTLTASSSSPSSSPSPSPSPSHGSSGGQAAAASSSPSVPPVSTGTAPVDPSALVVMSLCKRAQHVLHLVFPNCTCVSLSVLLLLFSFIVWTTVYLWTDIRSCDPIALSHVEISPTHITRRILFPKSRHPCDTLPRTKTVKSFSTRGALQWKHEEIVIPWVDGETTRFEFDVTFADPFQGTSVVVTDFFWDVIRCGHGADRSPTDAAIDLRVCAHNVSWAPLSLSSGPGSDASQFCMDHHFAVDPVTGFFMPRPKFLPHDHVGDKSAQHPPPQRQQQHPSASGSSSKQELHGSGYRTRGQEYRGIVFSGIRAHWSATVQVHSPSGFPDTKVCLLDMHGYYIRPSMSDAVRVASDSSVCDGPVIESEAILGRPTAVNPAEDVTFATQMSPDRLALLPMLAAAWSPGPMTVVVFYDPTATLSNMKPDLKNMLLEAETRVHVIVVRGCPRQAYPVNFLRNLAVSARVTEHYMVADADFFPSKGAYGSILHSLSLMHAQFAQDEFRNMVLVVPCFGYAREAPGMLVISEFEPLKTLFDQGEAIGGSPEFVPSHQNTNFRLWFSRQDAAYEVRHSKWFEPYVVCSSVCPPFPEEFEGWGMDKVSFNNLLKTMGFRFFVAPPPAFLFHRPHKRSADWGGTTIYWLHAEKRFHQFLRTIGLPAP